MKYLEHVQHEHRLQERRFRPPRHFVREDGIALEVRRLSYPSKNGIESTVLVQRVGGGPTWRIPARDLIWS